MRKNQEVYGLSDETVNDLCSVFACYGNIEKVLLFGSRAKGNFREGSDIDLALFGKDITFNQILDIKVRIEDLALLYTVDLVNFERCKNHPIGEHILRVGQPFYTA